MTTTARELDLEKLVLLQGAHDPNGKMCIMEAVAYVAGETWGDHPACASKVISAFLRSWNDALNNEDRQILKPLIPKLVGTAGDAATELRRSWMALDWYCRVSAPAWLRAAGLVKEAKAIEATAPITNAASAKAAHSALDTARKAAFAAGVAAWAAAWAAAGNAARAAAGNAARAAAWDAAWDAAGNAARDAAWDAAWAAAWDAARNAAGDAAGDALRPTVVTLQKSALELVERMIAA